MFQNTGAPYHRLDQQQDEETGYISLLRIIHYSTRRPLVKDIKYDLQIEFNHC
jgi:hypothetical protein